MSWYQRSIGSQRGLVHRQAAVCVAQLLLSEAVEPFRFPGIPTTRLPLPVPIVTTNVDPSVRGMSASSLNGAHVALGLWKISVRYVLAKQCNGGSILVIAQIRRCAPRVTQPARGHMLPVDGLSLGRIDVGIELELEIEGGQHVVEVIDLKDRVVAFAGPVVVIRHLMVDGNRCRIEGPSLAEPVVAFAERDEERRSLFLGCSHPEYGSEQAQPFQAYEALAIDAEAARRTEFHELVGSQERASEDRASLDNPTTGSGRNRQEVSRHFPFLSWRRRRGKRWRQMAGNKRAPGVQSARSRKCWLCLSENERQVDRVDR